MKSVFNKNFIRYSKQITYFIQNFSSEGEDFGNQERNSLKTFQLNDTTLNVKSFKKPNVINKITYRFFRKSKAQRSFEYANKLLKLGINTPQPIAYFQNYSFLFFKNSYYISEHLDVDLTFRELIHQPNYPDHENILRQFTKFTFDLHEKGILFLDHSPGNTLIKKNGAIYEFYLVDLNRMKFENLDFNQRIKNFSRLTPKKEMVKVMSAQYASLTNQDVQSTFDLMWKVTSDFRKKALRKKKIKRMLYIKK